MILERHSIASIQSEDDPNQGCKYPLENQCTLLFRLACETSSMSTSASTSIPTTPSSSQPDEILPSPSGYESGGDSGIFICGQSWLAMNFRVFTTNIA